ncbi:MAG: peptidoglycan-binding domain-containing protein [Minisyncoccia bacterium]
MQRTFTTTSVLTFLFLSFIGLFIPVFAFATVPPTLSLLATGSGDNVQITVYGDPNVSVLLSYTEAGSGAQIVSLGTTDGSGNFTTTVSSATYGLTSGTLVTAILNGTGGPKSPTVAWPTVSSTNALSLSQNAIVIDAGSSASITASNIGSTALYVSNNSNSSIANVSINGTQVTISGNTAGSTTVTLCQVGNATTCPSVYVTVLPAGASQLNLSQTNAMVVSGQNLPITLSGGNGIYQVQNDSNSSVIQASISGSVLTLSTGSTSGSSSITVCSSDMASCGIVVAAAGSSSSLAVSFSSSAPVVSTGQSTTLNIYGPSGVQFYVSSNSSPSIVQANLSGTTLTLTGIAQGTSSISVCASTGTCASVNVTVQYASTGNNITISQNALSLLSGQNSTIAISGGTPPYFVSGGTNSVSQETLNGSTLTVYGVASGVSSVSVCSSGGGCAPLTVTVNGATAPAAVAPTVSVPAMVSQPSATPAFTFTKYLVPGSTGTDVTQLQTVLAAQGFLSAAPTGYFGSLTEAAVLQFQAAHGLTQLGVVGPGTRAALNQIETTKAANATSVAAPSGTAISSMTLSQLQAQVQSLESQLTQALARISQLSGQ